MSRKYQFLSSDRGSRSLVEHAAHPVLLPQVVVEEDPGLVGNLLVERMVGAHIELVTKEEYVKHGSMALGEQLRQRLQVRGLATCPTVTTSLYFSPLAVVRHSRKLWIRKGLRVLFLFSRFGRWKMALPIFGGTLLRYSLTMRSSHTIFTGAAAPTPRLCNLINRL